jgi:hypothetical protein
MVRCGSLLSQILGLVPRGEFAEIVRKHGAERGTKGFTCWDQFVSMVFCQLGQAHSLREIVGGLGSMLGRKVHLGLKETPKRSTLSYANAHRPWQVYEDVFHALLDRGMGMLRGKLKRPLRFKNPLFSMDASVIDLCLSIFPWAEFRQTKGAVKLHMVINHEGYLPVFADLTTGKTHEIKVARTLLFPKGSIVVFDRGYNDYAYFASLCAEEVFFVTRAKDGMVYEVVEERPVPERGNILSDKIIRLTSARGRKDCPHDLRLVEVWVPEKSESMVFVTNHLAFGPTTIAAIYKERWQIENFFKAIKQNLRIKTFVGTSKNALYTQIWTALIAILMLKIMALRSKLGWSLSTLVALLRWNLFAYRDLWEWVDNPYGPPPFEDLFEQPSLFDNAFGQHLTRPHRGTSS